MKAGKSRVVGIAVALIALPLSLYLAFGMISAVVAPGAEGTIQAAGPDVGHWQMKIDDCRSGQREQFFGVILLSDVDKRLAVKLVQPPASEQLAVVNAPGTNHADVFKASQCALFKLDMQRSNSTYNGVWSMHGTLALDCTVEGDRVWGEVHIENCH